MKRLALLATVAMVPFAAHGATLQSGSIGGMSYYVLPASGGCSAATPCSVVTYLHYMGGQDAAGSDIQKYFGGSFAQANPHTIVIAPMLTANQSADVNWGGFNSITTPQQAQMVDVVKGVEAQMGNTVNRADTIVTGGSLGGTGTQAALVAYGPNGTVEPGVFSAGVSFDAALWPASSDPSVAQALCGVPLLAVHGTNDQEHAYAYDQDLKQRLTGCSGFTLVPVSAGHGTWAGSSGLAGGSPLTWIGNQLSSGGSAVPDLASNYAETMQQQGNSACAVTAAGSGGFHVAGGQIIGPDGKAFIARGFGAGEWNMEQVQQRIDATFPGANYIRLAVTSYGDPSKYAGFVQAMTSRGRVVVFSDINSSDGQNRGGATGTVFMGGLLAKEQAWYAKIAAAFKSNPYVWLSTNNEPSDVDGSGNHNPSALSAWQKQTYETIRAAGFQNIVETSAADNLVPSYYAGMRNIVWDQHFYNWSSGYSTDANVLLADLTRLIDGIQKIQSTDGKVPVLIGEFGNSTTGSSNDPGGNVLVSVVINQGSAGKHGSAAWSWAGKPITT